MQAALQNYRLQNADLTERIKSMTMAAEEHLVMLAQQSRDNEALTRELTHARAESAALRSDVDVRRHRASEMLDGNGVASQIATLAKQRDDALARLAEVENRGTGAFPDVSKLQGEIRTLQAELRAAAVNNATEFDDERQKAQKTIADLMRQLKQANKTIDAFTAAEQTADVQLKRANSVRSDEVVALQKQLASLERENNELRKTPATDGDKNTAELQRWLEDALNQRDSALRQLRHSQRAPADSKTVKQLQLAHVALADLGRENTQLRRDLMLAREQAQRSLHDHRMQREALQRTINAGATRDRDELVRQLAAQEGQILELQARTWPGDGRMMHAYMAAKQKEVNSYRAALAALMAVAHGVGVDTSAEPHLRRQAVQALHDAEQAANLELPDGWEQRTTDAGLVYYVDHVRKASTWLHPRFGSTELGTVASSFPVPVYNKYDTLVAERDPMYQSIASDPRELMASIRAVQAKTRV